MRVLALTRYSALAASTRQRFTQFLPALAKAGVDVTVHPLLGDDYVASLGNKRQLQNLPLAYLDRVYDIVMRARKHDALWVQYEAFPFLPGQFERLLTWSRRPYLVDYDDAIFHNYDASGGPLRRWALARKLVPLLANAQVCTVGNRYLADYTNRYCPATVIIPTVVDTERYRPLPTRPNGRLRVGWIGSPSTWPYVEPLLPVILPVLRRFDAELHIVGAPKAANQDGIRFIAWSEETEVAAVQTFDVGLMPLSDDPWARGKCGYKLIQYMSCGVPCIASPVGVNREIVSNLENGFLATERADWVNALTWLLRDADLRARMGKQGRSTVETRYSLAAQTATLVETVRGVTLLS